MKWIGGLLTIAVIMGWVATASIPAATGLNRPRQP